LILSLINEVRAAALHPENFHNGKVAVTSTGLSESCSSTLSFMPRYTDLDQRPIGLPQPSLRLGQAEFILMKDLLQPGSLETEPTKSFCEGRTGRSLFAGGLVLFVLFLFSCSIIAFSPTALTLCAPQEFGLPTG
jgi:hypothetical protein